ncbi:hypothetical protein [Epibacterium ulvae]|uniref:hypothetical protein n=1 Tax=Epibacterium ulvae TaxID=1156985 RepID=UPI001BFC0027|nr:hypothetical protein [Epibacterium ulvae]
MAVLTREIHCAGVEQHDALGLLRDAPDKIEAALTRGPGAFVVYRLDPNGARGVVTDSEPRLERFVAAAEYESAPLFGFCPATIAELATHIDAGAASLKKGG